MRFAYSLLAEAPRTSRQKLAHHSRTTPKFCAYSSTRQVGSCRVKRKRAESLELVWEKFAGVQQFGLLRFDLAHCRNIRFHRQNEVTPLATQRLSDRFFLQKIHRADPTKLQKSFIIQFRDSVNFKCFTLSCSAEAQ
jgi:hypothetical protein